MSAAATSSIGCLALPLIAAAQAQKHVTHNEALGLLDALVHLSVKSHSLTAPPASPAAGDRQIVAAPAAGGFGGHAGEVAEFDGDHWRFLAPRAGWLAWLEDEHCPFVHDGAGWGAEIRRTQRQRTCSPMTAPAIA